LAQAGELTFNLSQIDLERLPDEFAKKVRHKATATQDIRDVVEQKLAQMLARNPGRMNYQQKCPSSDDLRQTTWVRKGGS
jgi:type I restriction enzyme R subunit